MYQFTNLVAEKKALAELRFRLYYILFQQSTKLLIF